MLSEGLLIVNADDLGLSVADTEAIITAHAAGAITSATAMVWMADSERAAARARETGLPVGLHLNLIEPFDGGNVPPDVAACQRRVAADIARGPGAYIPRPGWARDFTDCIAGQVSRFTQLYGRPPTHFDGHRHHHLVPNALLSGVLRSIGVYRRPMNRIPQESHPLKQRGRDLWYLTFRSMYASTRWCFSIRAIVPELGGAGNVPLLARARVDSVEVMVHPGWADEQAVLLSGAWRDRLRPHRLASYADL